MSELTPETGGHYACANYQRTADLESRAYQGMTIEERYYREACFALKASGPSLDPGDRILDLACGIGAHADVIRRKTGVSIEALDLARPLIEVALAREREARSRGACGEIHFSIGDMTRLSDSLSLDARYALVTLLGCSLILGKTRRSYERALRDMHRAMTPRGRLVIQFRERVGEYGAEHHKRCTEMSVRSYERKADGPNGKFGRAASAGERVFVIEDLEEGDGFYWLGSRSEEDADGVPLIGFTRVYFNRDGCEEVLPKAEFLDYMNIRCIPALKSILRRAGFVHVSTNSASLSEDRVWNMIAVVASNPM